MKIIVVVGALVVLFALYGFLKLYTFTKNLDAHMTESYENEL